MTRGEGGRLLLPGLPQNLWAECRTGSPSSDPQRARVLAAVQARRSAPPPLRGAHGVDTGSAHARPVLLSDDDQFPTPASEGDDPPRMQNVPRHRKRIPFRNPRQVLQHPSDAEGERDAVEDYLESASEALGRSSTRRCGVEHPRLILEVQVRPRAGTRATSRNAVDTRAGRSATPLPPLWHNPR